MEEDVAIPSLPSEIIEQLDIEKLWRAYSLRVMAYPEMKDVDVDHEIEYGDEVQVNITLMIERLYVINPKTGKMQNATNKRETYDAKVYLKEYWRRITLMQKELYRMQKESKLTESIDIDKWTTMGEK